MSIYPIWDFFPWSTYDWDQNEVNANIDVANDCEFTTIDELPAIHIFENPPPLDLKISLDGYTPDCFTAEFSTFVSKKFRDAIGPQPGVKYFDVLPDRLIASARAMDYKAMKIVGREDVIDMEKSVYEMTTIGNREPMPSFSRIIVKSDLVPSQELFLDSKHFGGWFCTDALAMRVLKAGCTAVRFTDPATTDRGYRVHIRTLRGIEEVGEWDEVRNRPRLTLVEEIPMLQ